MPEVHYMNARYVFNQFDAGRYTAVSVHMDGEWRFLCVLLQRSGFGHLLTFYARDNGTTIVGPFTDRLEDYRRERWPEYFPLDLDDYSEHMAEYHLIKEYERLRTARECS